MVRISLKEKKVRRLLVILTVFVTAVTIGLVYVLLNAPQANSSERNIELMTKARVNLDPSICDQIRGDIKQPPLPKHLNVNVFMNRLQDMTESEAKEKCKQDVQWQIDHKDER